MQAQNSQVNVLDVHAQILIADGSTRGSKVLHAYAVQAHAW